MLKDKTGKTISKREVVQKGFNRAKSVSVEFGLMILRWCGHIPSHHIRRFAYRLAGVKIGKGSTIHMWCRFSNPSNIEIGEDTIVGDHAMLDGRAKLSIGNHTAIASSVMIYNSQHDINDKHFTPLEKEVTIGDYVFIGPRAIILPGVTIKNGAVVAAGAVVTKSVMPFTVVGGVPAREIRKRNLTNPQYVLGRARWFQ